MSPDSIDGKETDFLGGEQDGPKCDMVQGEFKISLDFISQIQ
jgi:hypothetical protein